MPLYKSYGFGPDNPVVLDIGEAYTKLGFAGEAEPRAVIPTAVEEVGKLYILHVFVSALVCQHAVFIIGL